MDYIIEPGKQHREEVENEKLKIILARVKLRMTKRVAADLRTRPVSGRLKGEESGEL